MRDNIELVKPDGVKVPGLRASVQGNKIFMGARKLVVEAGDLIIRKLSTGAEETYRVIDPGFYEAFHPVNPAPFPLTILR